MGVYLSKPKTDKKSEDGGSYSVTRYGLTSMQGWRKNMEDAHLVQPELKVENLSLFGVFDGHGGPAVSGWAGKHFVGEFEKNLAEVKAKFQAAELSIDLEIPCSHDEAVQRPPRKVEKRERGGGLNDVGGDDGSDDSDDEAECKELENIIEEEYEENIHPRSLPEEVVMLCEALQRTFLSLDERMRTEEARAELKQLHEELKNEEDEEDEVGQNRWLELMQRYFVDGKNGLINLSSASQPGQFLGSDEDDGFVSPDPDEESDEELGGLCFGETDDLRNDDNNKLFSNVQKGRMHAQVEEITDEEFGDTQPKESTADSGLEAKVEEKGGSPSASCARDAASPAKNTDESAAAAESEILPAEASGMPQRAESSSYTATGTAPPWTSTATKKAKKPIQFTAASVTRDDDDEGVMSFKENTGEDSRVLIDSEEDEDDSGAPRMLSPHEPEHCGATAVVAAVLRGDQPLLIAANAGDSRVVLSRNGSAIPLSKDHKPNLSRETRRILAAGGRVMMGRVDGNLNLSRCVGDLAYKSDTTIPQEAQKISAFPDVRVIPITRQDEFAVLACDGIWDCMSNQELVDYIKTRLWESSNFSPDQREDMDTLLSRICEEICDNCVSRNPMESEGIGCDNMTIMIIQFGEALREKASSAFDSVPRVYTGRLYKKLQSDFNKQDVGVAV